MKPSESDKIISKYGRGGSMSSNNKRKDVETIKLDGIEFAKDEQVRLQLDNPFVSDLKNGKIIYSKDFYMAMNKQIESGKTYVEAYEALGFDVKILGKDRANSAGKRAVQMAKEGKLNTVDPSSYDGSVPREKMGEMSMAEELAYLRARTSYLEEMEEAKKKFLLEYAESILHSKSK